MECAEQVTLYETRYRGTWKRMEHELNGNYGIRALGSQLKSNAV